MKALVSCIVALATAACALAQSPSQTVQSFLDSWNRKDFKAASALVRGGKLTDDISKLFPGGEFPILKLAGVSEKIDGASAVVTGQLAISGITDAPPVEPETVHLSRVGDSWLILPTQSDHRGEVIGMIGYMMTNQDLFANAKRAAQKTACLSNVKQIALGCLLLAGDHDDVLKMDASNFKSKLAPYLKKGWIFTCPNDKAGATSYAFNPNLANKNLAKISRPSDVVLIYEGAKGVLTYRHGGKANVAFADGHCKAVTAEEAKKLIWKP